MSSCKFDKEWLTAWLDGEAGKMTARVRDHLEHCPECANEVDAWRRAGDELRAVAEAGTVNAEPLVALQHIRGRIERASQQTLGARLRAWWSDLWLLNRRALAGVGVAAALGAVSAPGLLYWVTRDSVLNGPPAGAVVLESLEVGGNATAVVLSGDSGEPTLIWVEPETDATPHEETL
jgi:anti-sigma factor RsiW